MLSQVFALTHAPAHPEDKDHTQTTMGGRNSALSRMLVILSFGCAVNIICSLISAAAFSSSCVENCFNTKENEPTAVNITSCVQNCISNKTAEKRRKNPIAGSGKRDNDEGSIHPIHTLFVRTSDIMADKMAYEFAKYGKYHNYLKVNQIKSRYCLGYNVVLKVLTDDTTFFNKKNAVLTDRKSSG